MIEIQNFTSVDLDESDRPLPIAAGSRYQSDYMQLAFDGKVVIPKILGCTIEAQYKTSTGHYILFIELGWENLLIYLIDESFQLLEKTGLSYSTCDGSFALPETVNENTVHFTFYTDERWSLTFHPHNKRIKTLDFAVIYPGDRPEGTLCHLELVEVVPGSHRKISNQGLQGTRNSNVLSRLIQWVTAFLPSRP
ncbi:MAG: hypothetical protein ABIK92_18090 [Pseudomonadota bacterium]